MNILPTAYLGPKAWYEAYFAANGEVLIEVQESFVKQTYRNRCLIHDVQGHEVTLTVPVLKVEHKQLTQDVQISYQQHWQHQHWMALRSAYGKSPYWDYYADYFAPFYERQIKWLLDLNDGLHDTVLRLLRNQPDCPSAPLKRTEQFVLTDLERYWGGGVSILDYLMEYGPATKLITDF